MCAARKSTCGPKTYRPIDLWCDYLHMFKQSQSGFVKQPTFMMCLCWCFFFDTTKTHETSPRLISVCEFNPKNLLWICLDYTFSVFCFYGNFASGRSRYIDSTITTNANTVTHFLVCVCAYLIDVLFTQHLWCGACVYLICWCLETVEQKPNKNRGLWVFCASVYT